MKVYRVKPGKGEGCLNCKQIGDSEYEGTCLVCGAVWSHDPSESPTFVRFHRDEVDFGIFGL